MAMRIQDNTTSTVRSVQMNCNINRRVAPSIYIGKVTVDGYEAILNL